MSITTGLGNVELTISLAGMDAEKLARVQTVFLRLKRPDGSVIEVQVPPSGFDRVAKTAVAVAKIETRGTYMLGSRVTFTDGTTITGSTAVSFMATDGF
jgi:hypothetical protein